MTHIVAEPQAVSPALRVLDDPSVSLNDNQNPVPLTDHAYGDTPPITLIYIVQPLSISSGLVGSHSKDQPSGYSQLSVVVDLGTGHSPYRPSNAAAGAYKLRPKTNTRQKIPMQNLFAVIKSPSLVCVFFITVCGLEPVALTEIKQIIFCQNNYDYVN